MGEWKKNLSYIKISMFINYSDKEKGISRKRVLKDFEEMQAIVECCGSDKSLYKV